MKPKYTLIAFIIWAGILNAEVFANPNAFKDLKIEVFLEQASAKVGDKVLAKVILTNIGQGTIEGCISSEELSASFKRVDKKRPINDFAVMSDHTVCEGNFALNPGETFEAAKFIWVPETPEAQICDGQYLLSSFYLDIIEPGCTQAWSCPSQRVPAVSRSTLEIFESPCSE